MTVRRPPIVALCAVLASPFLLAILPASLSADAISAWYPAADTIFVPCYGDDGENVNVTGWLHVVVASTFDANGGLHIAWHWMAQGRGIGEESGYEYVFNEAWPWSKQYLPAGEGLVDQEVLTMRLIGKGKAPNLKVKMHIKTTITPDGDVVVDILRNEVICK